MAQVDFHNHPLNVSSNVGSTNLNNVNVATNVRATAYKLEQALNDTHSFEFFCKVARALPENVIMTQLEIAQTKRNPAAYFSKVCKVIMATR